MLYGGRHDTVAAHDGLLDRTILLVDGFSKTFAMTGWRLGYAALPAELVEPITRLLINSVSCTAPAVQLAGVAALTGPRDEVDAMLAEFERRRERRRRRAERAAGRLVRDAARAPSTPSRTSPARAWTRAPSPTGCSSEAGVAVLAGTAFGGVRRGLPAPVLRQLAREHRGGARGHGRRCSARSRCERGDRRIVVTPPHPRARARAPARRRATCGSRRTTGRSTTDGAARGRGGRRRRRDAAARPRRRRVPRRGRPAACGSSPTSPSATTTSTWPPAPRRGVVCTNTPGVLTDATADIAFALILMATRRLGEGERLVRVGRHVVVEHVLHARDGAAGQDARHRRPRPDRHRDRPPGARVRDGDRLHAAAAAPTPALEAELDAALLDARRAARDAPTSSPCTAR